MTNTPMAIANEFLKQPNALCRLTQMQVLKLTYIAHGWNLAVNGTPLINEAVNAWDYGPVTRSLYDHIKFYGTQPITRLISDTDDDRYRFFGDKHGRPSTPYVASLKASETDVISRVWNRYGRYSGIELSNMTHRPGTPWFETYFNVGRNAVIPNDRIKAHYIDLAKAVA